MLKARSFGRARELRGWLATLAAGGGMISTAGATNYVVNTLVDESDGIGVGSVSLRDAINAANADTTLDTITFSVTGTITLSADLPNITEDLTITGPGAASLTLSGANTYRAFKVMNSADLRISAITISNMFARGGDGRSTGTGGAGGGAGGMGPALFVNAGTATISAVTFNGNAAEGGDVGSVDSGSAYYAGGGGGGFGGPATPEIDGSDGGFLGGTGGGWGCPGNAAGEGAGGGGGGCGAGPTNSAGGAGGFGGGGGGGSEDGLSSDDAGNGGAGGFGGGGGGVGRVFSGTSTATGGSGGTFGGNGGPGTTTNQGRGGGGAGLGGAIFARAGTTILVNCTLSNNSATGGSAGGSGATNGQGKGGAIFVNTGATVLRSNLTFTGNSASDDTNTTGDDNDVYGTLGTLPAVSSIARASTNPSNAATVDFTVTFNTSVTGVNTADFQVASSGLTVPAVQSVSGSGATYTVTVATGNGDGSLTLNVVDDDSIVDGSSILLGGVGTGNGDFTGTESFTIDKTAPGITLASSSASTVNGPITVTATLSQASTNFAAGDVTPANASVTNFSGSGTSYSFTLSPAASGAFSAAVNGSTFTDAAGNSNTVSNTLSSTFDNLGPTVTLSSSAANPTNGAIVVTATLSESSTTFGAEDVNATNGTVGNFSGSGISFSFTVTPVADGAVSIGVDAAALTDEAGNNNTASNTLTRTFDATRPTIVSITPASTSLTTQTSTTLTVTFSEDVSGFEASDVSVTHTGTSGNSPTVSASSASLYVVTIDGLSDSGSFTVAIGAESVSDTVGNTNASGATSTAVTRQSTPTSTNGGGNPTPTDTATGDTEVGGETASSDADGDTGDETDALTNTTDCGAGACGPVGITQMLMLAGLIAIQRKAQRPKRTPQR